MTAVTLASRETPGGEAVVRKIIVEGEDIAMNTEETTPVMKKEIDLGTDIDVEIIKMETNSLAKY